MKKDQPKLILIHLVVGLVILALASYGGYRFWLLNGEYEALTKEKQALQQTLDLVNGNLATTTEAWQEEKKRNDDLASDIAGIAGTVQRLDKLSKTDRELLKKYSKIYFLNENYIPANLATITPEYLYNEKQPQQILAGVWPKLERLLKDATKAGLNLQINSAYRSFGTQAAMKSTYKVIYGSGANKFSADQGYSEHQMGTTVDFGTQSIKGDFSKFDKTPENAWLSANAYQYGFIMSYPKDNVFYQYEPWHWRFVGVELATYLHDNNKSFYTTSQRLVDTYLIKIFD